MNTVQELPNLYPKHLINNFLQNISLFYKNLAILLSFFILLFSLIEIVTNKFAIQFLSRTVFTFGIIKNTLRRVNQL